MDKFDKLKLENQLCFPLYAASKEMVRKYTALLNDLGITYTQYITLLVLWEQKKASVKELGEKLFLDSGTLTPVLKILEGKGYITRKKSDVDERMLEITVTEKGELLKKRADEVSIAISQTFTLSFEDLTQLYVLLYKLLGKEISPTEVNLVKSIVEKDE